MNVRTSPAPGSPQPSPVRRALTTLLAVGVFAAAFPVWSWLTLGAGEAARAATELVMPVGAAWLLLLAGVLWSAFSGRRLEAAVLFVLWGLMAVLFSQPLSDWSMRSIEAAPAPSADEHERPFKLVIVLGGGAGLDPLDRPELGRDGQRIMSAAQLWHAGKTQAIITTGSSAVSLIGPAEIGEELLRSVGVPASVIFQVGGENTQQEMRNLETFFENPPAELLELLKISETGAGPDEESSAAARLERQEVGLITSAFHMPRAQRLAAARNLDFTPLPCSYRTGSDTQNQKFSPRALIPDAGAVQNVSLVLKEKIARLVGR